MLAGMAAGTVVLVVRVVDRRRGVDLVRVHRRRRHERGGGGGQR